MRLLAKSGTSRRREACNKEIYDSPRAEPDPRHYRQGRVSRAGQRLGGLMGHDG
jgi:hypothetical protein